MNLEVMIMSRNALNPTGEGGLFSQKASSVVPPANDIGKGYNDGYEKGFASATVIFLMLKAQEGRDVQNSRH